MENERSNIVARLKNLITVRDIFYIFIGFLLSGSLAVYAFNFYMSSAVKVGGLVFQEKAYTLMVRPAAEAQTPAQTPGEAGKN